MPRPLSDPVPLRETSVWPGYDRIAVIPRVYGRARIAPLRYSEAGTVYVLADHPLAGVDAVTLDGSPVSGWRWRNGGDVTGHAVAFLELPEAPDTSAELAAEVRGLDGNPAAIIADLYHRDDLQDFRIYCRNNGLILGGSLAEKMTVRAAIQFVAAQVGCVWSAGLPGFVLPFPPPATDPNHAVFSALDLTEWSVEAELNDLVTRVTVPFAWDYAAGKATQSFVLEAKAASAAHGVREAELALPWVTTARQALATATAWLQWRARPLWRLSATVGVEWAALQPGGWIGATHPRLPQSGRYVLTDVDPGYGRGAVTLAAEAPAGAAPAVTIIRQSSAFEPIQTSYTLSPGGDSVTVTITDETGQPLPGAKVWIDGQGPQTADAAARIRFRATPGDHVLHVEADGRTAVDTTLTL